MEQQRIWVARLDISYSTEQKIRFKHEIEPDEVRDAVECVPGLLATWENHPERGRRALIEAGIRHARTLVVLYPKWDPMGDCWNLGSVYFV